MSMADPGRPSRARFGGEKHLLHPANERAASFANMNAARYFGGEDMQNVCLSAWRRTGALISRI